MLVKASRRLLEALKLHNEPAYKLAWRCGLHPSSLSKLVHGAQLLQPNDARIIAVGRELGLAPGDCFETVPSPAPEMRERTAATA
jgi:hypothetical protein